MADTPVQTVGICDTSCDIDYPMNIRPPLPSLLVERLEERVAAEMGSCSASRYLWSMTEAETAEAATYADTPVEEKITWTWYQITTLGYHGKPGLREGEAHG